MVRVAICDDERTVVDEIEAHILMYGKMHNIGVQIYKFYEGEMLVSSEIKFDIIFLDGQMIGMDGIETASMIREKNMDIPIVFITSFAYYSMPAHSVHSFDFIIKPFKYEDLERVLNDLMRSNKVIPEPTFLEVFTDSGALIMQDRSEIIYFEKDKSIRRKLVMHTTKKEILINGTISEIITSLDSGQFFMPHASFIINLEHVRTLENLYTIQMTGGYEIPLSQKRKEEFMDKLHKFARRNSLRSESYEH